MSPSCCSFCGAEYASSEAKCWDCKMALAEMPAPTLAADAPDDEVLYELDDWPVESRVKLTATFAERGIPSRWEPGLTIAVLEVDDEVAEQVLDELEEELADDEDWDDELEELDDDDGSSDSATHAAMGDLFVAADRLMHEPADEDVAGDLVEAGTAVEAASRPPFGIDPGLWRKVQALSSVVRGDLVVGAQDARTLRDTLRPLV
ncbi:MAG TPA: hypothetical protein VG455_13915 [Acidimicrobiales bacterium]|nr:hypothetical protein [Acidimicrobiales bacterium]